MEEELGYDLFFTHQRQQKLTSEGERFYYKASRLVDEYNDLLKPPQIQETASQGQIFLGFPDVAGICLFSNLIADFSRLYPNVKLQIKENGSKRIMQMWNPACWTWGVLSRRCRRIGSMSVP